MATDYDYELIPPKPVRQQNIDTCWACSLSAVLAANMSAKQSSESDLIHRYSTSATGGIVPAKLAQIASDFDYQYNHFATVADARSILTDSLVRDRLRGNGMMMMAWRIHDPQKPSEVFFHAQIVYGVAYLTRQDIGTSRVMLKTLNPWNARYEAYPLFMIENEDCLPIFTCWPRLSHG